MQDNLADIGKKGGVMPSRSPWCCRRMKGQTEIRYLRDHRKVQFQTGAQKRSSDQSTPMNSGPNNWVFSEDPPIRAEVYHRTPWETLLSCQSCGGYSHLEINSGKCVPKPRWRMRLRRSETCYRL